MNDKMTTKRPQPTMPSHREEPVAHRRLPPCMHGRLGSPTDNDAPPIYNDYALPMHDKRPQAGQPLTDNRLAHTADRDPPPMDNKHPQTTRAQQPPSIILHPSPLHHSPCFPPFITAHHSCLSPSSLSTMSPSPLHHSTTPSFPPFIMLHHSLLSPSFPPSPSPSTTPSPTPPPYNIYCSSM